MAWSEDLFNAVMAALDGERTSLRRLDRSTENEDERLGLFWLPEVAFGQVVWKGLVAAFGVDQVHVEVAATAFDMSTEGRCDFVVELPGGEEVLWLELKYLQRVWPSHGSGWDDWRSWTENKYFASIGKDLWRWSRTPSHVHDLPLGCHHHGLLLSTFWGPDHADRPQKAHEPIPEASIIEGHLRSLDGPSLDAFDIQTAQRFDCRQNDAKAPRAGHDVFMQLDLLTRRVAPTIER